MKKFLLIASLTFGIAGFSQPTISHFSGTIEESGNTRIYERGTYTELPDELPDGENAAWDFTSVDFELQETYTNQLPTPLVVAEYPTCNFQSEMMALLPDTTVETASLYAMTSDEGGFTILGNSQNSISLKFDADAAFVGTFPMTYGYTSDDTVAGTFTYNGTEGSFSGTFSGTITSEFDGYGDLTYFMQAPELPEENVTVATNRLKVVLDITFGTDEAPDAGTLNQTSFYYYKDQALTFEEWPLVRTVHSSVAVPMLGVDQNTVYFEKGIDVPLSANDFASNAIKAYPNPVKNFLNISGIGNTAEIRVSDMNGRLMLNQQINTNSIDLSSLQTGMYFVRISSDAGTTVRKIIKE